MFDAWVPIIGLAVILAMIIVRLVRIECEIEEDRINRMLEDLKTKGEKMDEILLTRIRKEAYEQGYQDGKVDGYNLIVAKRTADVVELEGSKVYKCLSYTTTGMPTADVVEVVRCKDCKYKEGSVCDYSAVYVRPNGYCQWGEKR